MAWTHTRGPWDGLSYDEVFSEVEQALDALPEPWTYATDEIIEHAYSGVEGVGYVPKVTPVEFWVIVKANKEES